MMKSVSASVVMTLLLASLLSLTAQASDNSQSCASWLNQSVNKLHSDQVLDLCTLTSDKVVMVVNTASNCGFTPQFTGLESLYQRYKDRGFIIIGFPSDDFRQEADTEAETAEVCYINYGVTFPMTATQSVRGSNAHPIFQHLNNNAGQPGWNFNKYLVDRNGTVIEHYSSYTSPLSDKVTRTIEALL